MLSEMPLLIGQNAFFFGLAPDCFQASLQVSTAKLKLSYFGSRVLISDLGVLTIHNLPVSTEEQKFPILVILIDASANFGS